MSETASSDSQSQRKRAAVEKFRPSKKRKSEKQLEQSTIQDDSGSDTNPSNVVTNREENLGSDDRLSGGYDSFGGQSEELEREREEELRDLEKRKEELEESLQTDRKVVEEWMQKLEKAKKSGESERVTDAEKALKLAKRVTKWDEKDLERVNKKIKKREEKVGLKFVSILTKFSGEQNMRTKKTRNS